MLTWLALLAAQPVADTPIVLRHGGPARVVTVSNSSDCGAVAFDLNYSATREGVRGSLVARKGDQLFEASSIQNGLFAKLSYIDDATVMCNPDNRASVLISGVDKKTGEVDRLWEIDFSPESGFGDPRDISG